VIALLHDAQLPDIRPGLPRENRHPEQSRSAIVTHPVKPTCYASVGVGHRCYPVALTSKVIDDGTLEGRHGILLDPSGFVAAGPKLAAELPVHHRA
jgi:hypothetical protein